MKRYTLKEVGGKIPSTEVYIGKRKIGVIYPNLAKRLKPDFNGVGAFLYKSSIFIDTLPIEANTAEEAALAGYDQLRDFINSILE